MQAKTKAIEYKRTICPTSSRSPFVINICFCDGRLSMTGDWHGSHGQIDEYLSYKDLIPHDGFDYADLQKIQAIWERWHLNDMRAGTPRQEEFVRGWKVNHKYDYEVVCNALSEANLLYDNGYKYGSSWLKEEVPRDVIKYLFSLPALSGCSWSDVNPASINEEEFLNILGR